MLTYLMEMQPKPDVPSGSQLIDYYEEQVASREALIQKLTAENVALVAKIKAFENAYAEGDYGNDSK